MNSVSRESHTPNHVMQSSLGRPSPSRVEIAVRVAGLVLAGLTSIPMIAHAASINVPCQLAQLINAIGGAVNGDVLSLADGCIYVLPTANNTNVILGDNGLPLINQRLTIKGNGAVIMRSSAVGTPNFRIIEVAPGADLTLDGVTLENGSAGGTQRAGRGGGIYNLGTLRIEHSILSNNVATDGGGIGNGNAQGIGPVVQATLMLGNDSTLSGNSAAADGGGIANGISSTVNLTDCTISHNFANLPSSSGGGIASQGTAILNKCTITGNTATVGGGIANAGHLFLTDSLVTGNHAIAANIISCQFTGLGGGIFNAPVQDSTVTLIHSPVTGNEAIAAKSSSGCSSNGISNTGLGGGILNAAFGGIFGTTRLTDNDVIGNSAASGGGIANAGHMTLTLSNVSGNNSTGSGGGIFNVTDRGTNIPIAALTLTDSDITDNQAASGGGIFNEHGNKVTLNESTVIGNTPDDF
jgi:hypothetical protein